tara:strand:- start:4384 stop:4599 length:216 start_codon:yes stop_codon:yes gene_type:complete
MKSEIKQRVKQLIAAKAKVLNDPNEYIDKSSYIKILNMYIESLQDIIYIVEAVKSENQKAVSNWFARFRED